MKNTTTDLYEMEVFELGALYTELTGKVAADEVTGGELIVLVQDAQAAQARTAAALKAMGY